MLEIAPAVAAEQRQRRADLQVDLAAGLVGVVGEVLRDRVVVRGAGDVRRRQAAEHLARERGHRNRRAGRIDDAGARIADVDAQDARRSAPCVGSVENAVALRSWRKPSKSAKKNALFLHDRSAERAAVLVAAQRRLRAVGRLEVGLGVQRGVAEELPARRRGTGSCRCGRRR